MNKKTLAESEISDRYISPALLVSGWCKMPTHGTEKIDEWSFTKVCSMSVVPKTILA
jgi:hypothetical protein